MIEKYFPKGGGKDPRVTTTPEARVMRSIGKHYEKKRALKGSSLDKALELAKKSK